MDKFEKYLIDSMRRCMVGADKCKEDDSIRWMYNNLYGELKEVFVRYQIYNNGFPCELVDSDEDFTQGDLDSSHDEIGAA